MKIRGCVLADIHIGAFDVEKQLHELSAGIFTYLHKLKQLDLLVICGDFFDKLFPLNSIEALYARKVLIQFAKICEELNTVLRIVYGTESHDSHQYEIFKDIFESRGIDYKIIQYAESEILFDDVHILYLPEEYIDNKGTYYANLFQEEKSYDYVFGHGVIREGMKEAALNMDNAESSSRKKVPVFSAGELKRICKGDVYFGHYHVNCEMLENVFYIGSYSRWIHGEPEQKGWYEFSFDTEKKKYKRNFLINQNAEIYQTISFGYNHPIFQDNDSLEEGLKHIDKLIKSKVFDHIRFEFNVPETCENPEYVIKTIKNRYKDIKSVKTNITHGYIEKKKEDMKKEIDRENEKYSFIFDKSIPKDEMLSSYIALDFDYEIPANKVSRYLYSSLEDILNE